MTIRRAIVAGELLVGQPFPDDRLHGFHEPVRIRANPLVVAVRTALTVSKKELLRREKKWKAARRRPKTSR